MVKKITLLLLLYIGNTLLWAADADAVRVYDEGFKAYQAGDYYKAANLFEDVRILADSPTIKANALRALVNAWKMSGMPYREFKAIETLLSDYPEFANFKELVLREYELGKAYYDGLREPAYWHLRWVPWLYGDNKCAEIYTAALKRAPFNPEAPGARLRLAHIYDEAGKIKSSLEQYRIILRDFPESEASRYAMLALANGLLILSRQGDGDGKHISEVHDLLLEFRKKYPNVNINVYEIENRFFGESVTVAGLLTGIDLREQLLGKPLGETLYISSNTLRYEGDLFLCGMHIDELSEALGTPIVPCMTDGYEFFDKLIGI